MIGFGCGIEVGNSAQGELPPLPPAEGFAQAYADVAGLVADSFEYPAGPYIDEAAGRLQDVSGWAAVAGAPDFAGGWISYPADVVRQTARHPFAQDVPAGATVRVIWRQRGTGAVRLRVGGDPVSDYVATPGWQAGDVTVTAPADRIEVDAAPGSLDVEVTDISVVAVALPAAHDIVLLLGGGNITGSRSGERPDPALDLPDPRVDVWSPGGVLPAVEPLPHRLNNPMLGPGLSFGRRYAETALEPGRRLLLVPCGKLGGRLVEPGATSAAQGASAGWHPQNTLSGAADLYARALDDAAAALALNPGGNRIVCAIWAGAEEEAVDVFQVGAYQSALRDILLPALRSDLGLPDLPVAVAGSNPAAVSPVYLLAEAQLDETSGDPLALPGVIHVPWQAAFGNGTRPDPADPGEAVYYSGSANRVRGGQIAQAVVSRTVGLLRLSVIGSGDVIFGAVDIIGP